MNFLIIALFVAVATAAPIEDDSGPVEVIVNGVPEGQAIDLSDVVDIKLQEHVNGEIAAATNLLHPYTAVGIAEAAAAAAAVESPSETVVVENEPEVVVPEPVLLPSPVAPEVIIPEPVVLPGPVAPEVEAPEPVVLPEPVGVMPVFPLPGVLPEPTPVDPEAIVPEVVVPAPASLPNGEIFNDGTVSLTVNTPQEAGVLTTLQSWFSVVLNYFNSGVQTTQQIV